MPTPTTDKTDVTNKSASTPTLASVATKTYRIKRGIWSLIDKETGDRETYNVGDLVELTADEYERNKRNVEII